MIGIHRLSKVYGRKRVVDRIDCTVQSGQVTALLGPNGAGKSTIMRMAVGLDRPTSGSITINGKRYAEHLAPLHEVGSLLDPHAVHPDRTPYNHLLAMATTNGIGRSRVDEVIGMTGLESVADTRVGKFSVDLRQRLGLAAVLLGDPATLVLDEPAIGLDPEGAVWVRQLVRTLAAEGRTVFFSSHLMHETAQVADHIIVLGRGRIIADATLDEFVPPNCTLEDEYLAVTSDAVEFRSKVQR